MPEETPNYVLALSRIRIDCGDHHKELVRGDSCDEVVPSTLETMVRLGQAVTAEEFEALEVTVEPDEGGSEGDGQSTDWINTPVGKLDLSPNAFKALNAAQLHTVEDVLEFGSEHGDLMSIDGIAEAIDKEVQEAIKSLSENQSN